MLHNRIQAWTGTLPPVRCPLVTGLRPQSGQSGSSGLEAPRGAGRGMGSDCSEAPGHAGDKARSGGFPESVVYNPARSFSANTSFLFMGNTALS